jgi:fructose-1,6-bisphosphatase
MKLLPLTKRQANAILFALGEEYNAYGKLDIVVVVVKRLFKLFPELKDDESNSDLVWYLQTLNDNKPKR